MQTPLFSFLLRQTKCHPKHSWPWRTMVWELSRRRLLNWLSELRWGEMRLERYTQACMHTNKEQCRSLHWTWGRHTCDWLNSGEREGGERLMFLMERSQMKSQPRAVVTLYLSKFQASGTVWLLHISPTVLSLQLSNQFELVKKMSTDQTFPRPVHEACGRWAGCRIQ